MDQYRDERPPKEATAKQKAGRHTLWPPPMYMRNELGHKHFNNFSAPYYTTRTKCYVDIKDLSGDRGEGAY